MERLQVCWGILSLVVLTVAQNTRPDLQSSYLLLVPKAVRPEASTSFTVTILTDRQVNVHGYIVHNNHTLTQNVSVIEPGETGLVILPPFEDGMFGDRQPLLLKVRGDVDGEQIFSNSTELQLDPRRVSTFIQTDKVKYLPGQLVKIRAVSVDPQRKPVISRVDFIIRDPRGNILRQWLEVNTHLGVATKEFQLSENPPLGKWTIQTTVKDIPTVKHFTVARYVLPRFEVVIDAPSVVYHMEALRCSVTAKYTYGKSVPGGLSLTVFHSHSVDLVYSEYRKIDGTNNFAIDVSDGMREKPSSLYDGSMEFLTILAEVTEDETGLSYNSSVRVSLARSKYKLHFEDYPRTLKPVPSTATLVISTYDGRPLQKEDVGKMVQVWVTQHKSLWGWPMEMGDMWDLMEMGDRGEMGDIGDLVKPVNQNASGLLGGTIKPEESPPEELFLSLPADGVITFNFMVMEETQVLTLDASFGDGRASVQLSNSNMLPTNSYLQIHKPSDPLQVGVPVHLYIENNFNMTDIHYMLMSKGQVVLAGRLDGDLVLVPSPSWAPLVQVIAYSLRPGGEIVNDMVELHVRQYLQNQVFLNWSRAVSQPADDVTLTLAVAEPSSLVGILVVDKAARLAGSENDITKERVMKGMQFSVSMSDKYSAMGNPNAVFEMCNLLLLTDAPLLPIRQLPIKPEDDEAVMFSILELGATQPEPRERSYFPETWIWMDFYTGNSTTGEISVTVPDSITSWVASAFVVSERLGLGVVEQPTVLTVLQDFFLSLNLPACIFRGEELVLEIVLYNYMEQELEVSVMVAWSHTFEFVFPEMEGMATASIRRVSVASQSLATVLVPIRPLVLGEMPISVKAVSATASDRIRRTVVVKAEGLEQSFSSSLLIELSSPWSNFSTHVYFTFPPDVVEGSKRVSVAVVGDILGPSISGLDSLIQLPYGCGEQNMINFAPNIYVLQYLISTGQDDPEVRERAENFMLSGYERELSYQRGDGSFSAFGDSDTSGSTWLSAFVLKCFLQAQPFIAIDDQVLQRAASWMAAQQDADGRFLEPGRVIHTELQGGLDGAVSLTAYVLIALLQDADIRAQYSSQVSAGLTYLEARLAQGVPSNYSLGLVAYALARAERPAAQTALSELIGRAIVTNDVPMWSSPHDGASSWQPRTAEIELASYVLLTQQELGRAADGLALMKWLSQQRNHGGGFGSTQDTIVALQALSTFAALAGSSDTNMSVAVDSETSSEVASFIVHQENHLLYQSQQIDLEDELKLQVRTQGQGLVLFQLNVFYNIRSEGPGMRRRREAGQEEDEEDEDDEYEEYEDEEGAFLLSTFFRVLGKNKVQVSVCCRLNDHLGLNATGMVIMEVGLLSGFGLLPGSVALDDVVKRVEVTPGKVVLYLDSVTTASRVCVKVPQVMEQKVAKVREAVVLVYDYYEPSRRSVSYYKSQQFSQAPTCSLCGDDCSLCQPNNNNSILNGAAPSGSSLLLTFILLLFITFSTGTHL